jgi:hypothetical protein
MSFDFADTVFVLLILATPIFAFILLSRTRIAPLKAFLFMTFANVVLASLIGLTSSFDSSFPDIWEVGLAIGCCVGIVNGLVLGLLTALRAYTLRLKLPVCCPPREQRSSLVLTCVCLLPWLWVLCGISFRPYDHVFDQLAIDMPRDDVEALLGPPTDRPSDEEAKRFSVKTFWDAWPGSPGAEGEAAVSTSYWYDGIGSLIRVDYKDGRLFRSRLNAGPKVERYLR